MYNIYLFSKASSLALDPPSFLSTCYHGLSLWNTAVGALATGQRLVPMLGMNEAVFPLPHTPVWSANGQL
jgi:hypothetical protein